MRHHALLHVLQLVPDAHGGAGDFHDAGGAGISAVVLGAAIRVEVVLLLNLLAWNKRRLLFHRRFD